jgi:hypothetical protein
MGVIVYSPTPIKSHHSCGSKFRSFIGGVLKNGLGFSTNFALIEGTKWGVVRGGGCGFLKSNAKRESVASLTKKKSRKFS